jgi:hypothetical protein
MAWQQQQQQLLRTVTDGGLPPRMALFELLFRHRTSPPSGCRSYAPAPNQPNRRVRTRMHGGVGGEVRVNPSLPYPDRSQSSPLT